jgi:hypothetical protein
MKAALVTLLLVVVGMIASALVGHWIREHDRKARERRRGR